MKKFIFVMILMSASQLCLAVKHCHYSAPPVYIGGLRYTESYEYYSENGSCCSPTAGYGASFITWSYPSGYESINQGDPYENSYLASNNPDCSIWE